ncbi:Guanine nucleotide binding protein (G-protein) [Macleaya cordata]|uniref:Guanine nucleotide binding protein (G-protein) n=1 Tax=Macleaya cordata TaxID=56857 RepID=A0A200R7A1_MACCD|nr:Guanine nucleotide binding protein (G-protein) [Macleaya cordata]
MTNTVFIRPIYEDETTEGSENSDGSGAVAISTETIDGLEAKLALLSAIRMNCFGCSESAAAEEKEEEEIENIDSSDIVQEDFSDTEADTVPERKEPETKVKKGLCYRCFKGNRFTEKEVCIVCNAKYCINCVLRAMGSMPEGRKCITCIGFPIDESKRKGLGECSRMLKRLLSELEIRQIMEVEKLCEANQLQAEYVYVNGKQLCQYELFFLRSCPNPPTELEPGCYWYDKESGYWGKEDQKPCKIISAHLNVGGPLMKNASNGNTLVFINNREITKVELRMLQLAGVQCAGNRHFWVDEDGSYQEEGQKNIKGNLWSKAGIKLVCAFLSLPVPSKAAVPSGEEINNSVGGVVPNYRKGMLQKLLLVGYNGSGTSTIFKQARILYKSEPFSEDELQNTKLTIQSNVYYYLGILLEGRERFEEESLTQRRIRLLDQSNVTGSPDERDDKTIYSIGPRLKAFSDWLLKVMVSGNLKAYFPPATREYAPLVEELWKDAAIQATFNRRSELKMLPSVASYFLEQIVNISRTDYEPSNVDVLYAKGITSSNDLASMDFSFPQSAQDRSIDASNQYEPLLRYQLIRVHTRGRGENCKWLEMFEDVGIVIFCVSLSDYDQFCDDGSGAVTNKMVASRRLFESIVTHPVSEEMNFLLILNKFDLLKEKIERVPLTQCKWFYDFNPVDRRNRNRLNSGSNINSGSSLAELAFHYIAVKFKRHFTSLTGRKLYVSMVNGLLSYTVDEALRYSREILKWDEERANFNESDYSIDSTESCSSMPTCSP